MRQRKAAMWDRVVAAFNAPRAADDHWDRRKLEALYKRECAKIRREWERVTMQ